MQVSKAGDLKPFLFRLARLLSSIGGLFYILSRFLAPLVAQVLLNKATLKVIEASIIKPSGGAFRLVMKVALAKTGPFATLIKYKKPLRMVKREAGKETVLAGVSIKGSSAVPAGGGEVEMDSVVSVAYDQVDAFGDFSKDLVLCKGQVEQTLKGDGVSISLFGGLVQIDGLSINKTVSLAGLGGLTNTVVHDIQVLGATSEYMILEADTSIYNPSNVALVGLGDVFCSMFYVASKFGSSALYDSLPHATVVMHDLTLQPGENRFKTRVNFQIPSAPGIERDSALEMLSNFICCKETTPILLRGHSRKATKIPYLFNSLTSLNIITSMPGLPPTMQMINSAVLLLHSPLATLAFLSAPTKMELLNSFAVPVSVLRMVGAIKHDGNPIGSLDQNLTSDPIVLPPNSLTWTREIWLKLAVGPSALRALFDFDTTEGVLLVDVDCWLDVKVGEYLVQGVKYSQTGLKTKLGLK
ncbi:hypothetical protein HDV03_001264 [Kappamyces sp. JEL0829]|nr:hypothetical protein HDV03_001264 [Kappamyces sp. JEL0829]